MWKMNFQEISKNILSFTDVQNVTAAVLSAIRHISRDSRRKQQRPSVDSVENQLMFPHHFSSEVEQDVLDVNDDPVVLAHNLSALLLNYYQNDSDLLEMLTSNLRDEEIRWMEEANRRLSDITFAIIIAIYIMVIFFGSIGNIVVVTSFVRQPALRTQRNSFILNLAISDLVLCLVTMPLTLLDIVNKHWPLGDSPLSCKVAGGLQAVSVFVSTISITAIALDRYQLIVYPTRDVLKRIGGAAALCFIWMLGFLLALPIFMVRTLYHHELDYRKGSERIQHHPRGAHSIDYCYEKWSFAHGHVVYSALTLVIQYSLPILIITIVHTRICRRLRRRHTAVESIMVVRNSANRIKAAKRLRRRHNLLMAIAIIFSITWLPLNVLNLVIDIHNPFGSHPEDEEKMVITYAVCHLFGMSSACINPFLYGWFNDNFRNEFAMILSAPFRLSYCFHIKTGSSTSSVPAQSSLTSSREVDNYPAVQQQKIELLHQSTIDMAVEGNHDESVSVEPSSGNEDDKNRVTITTDEEVLTRIPSYQSLSSFVDVELSDPFPYNSSYIIKTSLKKPMETYL